MTSIILALSLLLPMTAHSGDEIVAWLDAWEARVPPGGLSVESPLVDELHVFMERHADHFNPPPPSPAVRRVGVDRWRDLVARHFPSAEVDRALCIMYHESRGKPDAANTESSARGLMQIMHSLWGPHFGVSEQQLYDPETNVRIARKVWDRQGWWAWSPYKRGDCR